MKPEDHDWSKYEGTMPHDGIRRPEGEEKIALTERMKRAFQKVSRPNADRPSARR